MDLGQEGEEAKQQKTHAIEEISRTIVPISVIVILFHVLFKINVLVREREGRARRHLSEEWKIGKEYGNVTEE